MTTTNHMYNKRQGGWLSIELIAVLVIATLVGVSFSSYYVAYQSNNAAQVIAEHLKTINTATENYVKANWESIKTDASGGTAEIDFDTLINEGYLPSGFSNTNPIGQEYSVTAVPAPNDTLTIFIVGEGGQITTNGTLFGGDLNLVTNVIPRAARLNGVSTGFIPYQELPDADPDVLEGPDAAWTFDLASVPDLSSLNYFQGALASVIHMESGALNNDYLYRSDVGIPELNRMETTLDMHGNDILDAGTILARDIIIDDVLVDGVLPASVSRGVYTMTRMFPNDSIVKPVCNAPSSSPSIFVSVDSSPVGGAPGQGLTVATTSGNITAQVMSVRTRAVDAGSDWDIFMDVFLVGGTAGSTGGWYTLNAASGAQWEASMIVGTKCS